MTNFRQRKAGPGGYPDIYRNRVALAEIVGTWNENEVPTLDELNGRIEEHQLTVADLSENVLLLHDEKTDDDYELYYEYDNDGNVHIYELAIN